MSESKHRLVCPIARAYEGLGVYVLAPSQTTPGGCEKDGLSHVVLLDILTLNSELLCTGQFRFRISCARRTMPVPVVHGGTRFMQ